MLTPTRALPWLLTLCLAGCSTARKTDVLEARLERLEQYGLVTRTAYQENPARHEYRLTERGADLLPVLQALAAWSGKHIPGRWPPPAWFTDGRPVDFYPARARGRAGQGA